jgi:hypothetical protein
VDWLTAVYAVASLLVIGGLIYVALRIWRSRESSGARDKDVDFHPAIGFTRLDQWKSVALLLENRSDERVWTEEIEIALTDLVANQQASEASCHGIQKVHQNVPKRDMLPISLVETIYQAAGRPQRKYSCVMSSIVRYRAGEKWYEEPMKTYRLRMIGLTVAGIRRENKTVHQFKSRDNSQGLQATDATPR